MSSFSKMLIIYVGSPMKTSGSPLTMSGVSGMVTVGVSGGTRGLRYHSDDAAFFLHSK